jgi:hypothetical protein
VTKIINLYGGPGTGKSTSAAYVFHGLKTTGRNAELVRETAKDWAWEGRQIDGYSQFYLMGRQIRREAMLLGKVSHIVTDAPIMLYRYYAERYSPALICGGVKAVVNGYYEQLALEGHEVHHVFLERSKEYNPSGRYQTEEEAKAIDVDLWQMLRYNHRPGQLWRLGTESKELDKLVSLP